MCHKYFQVVCQKLCQNSVCVRAGITRRKVFPLSFKPIQSTQIFLFGFYYVVLVLRNSLSEGWIRNGIAIFRNEAFRRQMHELVEQLPRCTGRNIKEAILFCSIRCFIHLDDGF